MNIKIGDFVKLKEWKEFLEVTDVEGYIPVRIRITEGDTSSWYDVSLGFIKQGDEDMKSEQQKQDEFQVGDIVWCVAYGEGKVTSLDDGPAEYPLRVNHKSGGYNYYTKVGQLDFDGPRCLFFSEPKIEAAVTRPFVSTLVGKKVVVKEYACYPQIFTVSWEDEHTFGDDVYSCIKANCEVYEVQSENLLKK